MSTFLQDARERWPRARVMGDGKFVVVDRTGTVVYLAMDEAAARNIGASMDRPMFVELPTPCPDLDDDWEDVQRERRAKRAEKFNAKF
jgi:hypothetical protein